MAVLSTQSTDVLTDIRNLDTEQQAELVKELTEANPALIPVTEAAKVKLWRYLLTGAFVLGGVALIGGVILSVFDKGDVAAPLYVIAGAVVSGAFALFAKSPTAG